MKKKFVEADVELVDFDEDGVIITTSPDTEVHGDDKCTGAEDEIPG